MSRRHGMVVRLWRENNEFLEISKEYAGESKNAILNDLLSELRANGFENASEAIKTLQMMRREVN